MVFLLLYFFVAVLFGTGATARFTPTPMSSLYTMLPGFFFLSRTAGPLGTNRPTNTTKKKTEERKEGEKQQSSGADFLCLYCWSSVCGGPRPALRGSLRPPLSICDVLARSNNLEKVSGFRHSVWWRYDDDLDDGHGDDQEWKKRKQMKSNSLPSRKGRLLKWLSSIR